MTLKLAVSNNGNLNYASKTEFKSDKNGTIDLSKSVPECGSYQNPGYSLKGIDNCLGGNRFLVQRSRKNLENKLCLV